MVVDNNEATRESVRARLLQHYSGDRSALLYGHWQLLGTSDGPARLRQTLGPEGFRGTLAALAAAGIALPRLHDAGPATGAASFAGPGVPARMTVDRQAVRQATLRGVFAWGECVGGVDLSLVRAGAPGYAHDTILLGLHVERLLPVTYHRADVRGLPALVSAPAPVFWRFGGYSDAQGVLHVLSSHEAMLDGPEITAVFGAGGAVEVVLYRCYDGPVGDDTSFVVARGHVR
jgi:hypothetical protein